MLLRDRPLFDPGLSHPAALKILFIYEIQAADKGGEVVRDIGKTSQSSQTSGSGNGIQAV